MQGCESTMYQGTLKDAYCVELVVAEAAEEVLSSGGERISMERKNLRTLHSNKQTCRQTSTAQSAFLADARVCKYRVCCFQI